jgi:hypothetical protein
VNFSGGNENTQYFLNAGYANSKSLLAMGEGANEATNQFNLRANVNFRVNSYMKAFIDVAGSYDISKSHRGNYWNSAATLRPNLFTPLIDSSMVTNKDILPAAVFVNDGQLIGGTNIYRQNLYADLLLSGYTRTFNTTLNYRTGIDVDLGGITPGLTFRVMGSFAFQQNFVEGYNVSYAVYQPDWTLTGDEYTAEVTKIGEDARSGNQSIGNTWKRQNTGFYGILNYNRLFSDKHMVSGSLLAFTNLGRQTGVLYETKYNHLGARLNYVYDSRYIVDFSSVLTSGLHLEKENRLGFSPSVGLGWVLTNEDFFGNINGIDYLKLKASAGVLKTDYDIGSYYLGRTTFTESGGYSWGDGGRSNTLVRIANLGNPVLGYEKRENISVGADVVLFNALWLDISYIQERRSDLVTQRTATTPNYAGGYYPYVNYGEEKYSGLDLGLTFRKEMNDFGYELGGTFTYLTSQVVTIDEDWENDYQFRAGKRTDGVWALEDDGLFMSDDEITAHDDQLFGTVAPGDIKYVNQNDDDIIDDNDMVMVGNWRPDYSLGLHIRLRYKDLSFFALATGSFGHTAFSNSAYYWVYGDRKYSEVVLDRFQPDDATTHAGAMYPRLTSITSSNNFRNSTYWLYDNSRISLNTIQLTYDLQPLASLLKAAHFNLYVRGENLTMFAKERDKIQLNYNTEPQYATYVVGIKAIF